MQAPRHRCHVGGPCVHVALPRVHAQVISPLFPIFLINLNIKKNSRINQIKFRKIPENS